MAKTHGVYTSKADFDEGTMDNVTIGATTPAAATFTNLTATGNVALGDATTDTLAFYGVTPVAQRSGASQAAVATTAITTAVSTAVTSSSPYGFETSTQGDAIVAAVNSLIARQSATTTLVNEVRAALVALGLIAGS